MASALAGALGARPAALLLDERLALDVGALYTRCGVCGDPAPRRIVAHRPIARSVAGAPGARRHGPGAAHLGGAVGLNAQQAVLYSDSAADDQVSRLHERLVDHLQDVFLRALLMDPKGKRVILVDNVFAPMHAKLALARCLFEDFQVQSCTFVPAPVLAMLTTGRDAGLVVDVGYREATVTPIYDGRPLFPLALAAPLGGASVNARLRALLLEHGVAVAADGTTQQLSALPDAEAWLSLDTIEQLKSVLVTADTAAPTDVPKADGQTVRVPAQVQTAAAAHLFDGDDDGRSLPRLILDALLACPMDVRLPAAEHVLLTGGTTTMSGFSDRLIASVRALAAAEARYHALRPAAARLAVINSPFARGACSWTGASLGGVLRARGYEVTRETFARSPAVPDWTALEYSSGGLTEGDPAIDDTW